MMGYYHRKDEPLHIGEFYPECKVYSDGSHYIAIPHTSRPYKPRKKRAEEIITVKDEPSIEVSKEMERYLTGTETSQKQKPLRYTDATERSPPVSAPCIEDTDMPAVIPDLTADCVPVMPVGDTLQDSSAAPAAAPQSTRKLTRRKLFDELYAQTVGVRKDTRRKQIIAAMSPYFKDEKSAADFVARNFDRKRRNLIARRIRLSRKINLQDFNYFVTVGSNKQAVQKYIQNQEKEDMISAQISMVEYYDPFKEWLESYRKKNKKIK